MTGVLQGRVALITGASRGIGRQVAEALAREGAAVAMVARDAEALEQAAHELVLCGHDAIPLDCDVRDAEAVAALPERLGRHAEVDVLVNCAGVMVDPAQKMTLKTAPEEWRRVMATNLDGPFHLCATFVPGMSKRRHGRVVNVSACLGRMTGPGCKGGLAAYRVSKAALNALTKNLAAEVGGGRRGVLVDAACPGHVRSDMGGADAPRSLAQGADTIVWLATREDGPTGRFWEDREEKPW